MSPRLNSEAKWKIAACATSSINTLRIQRKKDIKKIEKKNTVVCNHEDHGSYANYDRSPRNSCFCTLNPCSIADARWILHE